MKYAFFDVKIKYWFIKMFCLGVIIGTVLVNALSSKEANEFTIYYKYIIDNCSFSNMNFFGLFLYCLKKMYKELIIVLLFGMTMYRMILHSGYLIYKGINIGGIISIFTLMNDNKGLVLYLVLFGGMDFLIAYVVVSIIEECNCEKNLNSKMKLGAKNILEWLILGGLATFFQCVTIIYLFSKII